MGVGDDGDRTERPFGMTADSSNANDPYQTRQSVFERMGSDDALVRVTGWDEFRRRYAPVIAGFAARCGAKTQDLDDIVQDVLTAFICAEKDFVYDRGRGRFRGYLKTITVRSTIRRIGRNARFRGVALEDLPDAAAAVEPVWDDVWEQELVAQAIARVKQERKGDATFRAFEQYVLLDRSAEVVAGELGISVDSVHQAKTRITKRLREVVQILRNEG